MCLGCLLELIRQVHLKATVYLDLLLIRLPIQLRLNYLELTTDQGILVIENGYFFCCRDDSWNGGVFRGFDSPALNTSCRLIDHITDIALRITYLLRECVGG